MPAKDGTPVRAIAFTPDMDAAITEITYQENKTRSAVIREALADWLGRRGYDVEYRMSPGVERGTVRAESSR